MKIERILYGMQTSNGKIDMLLSPGVRNLLTSKSIEHIRKLKPEDSHKYMWFPTEQTIAYPVIIEVEDKNPKHGGRTWVQNQTFIVNIHEFLSHTLNGTNLFSLLFMPELETFPENLDALNV